MTITHLLTLSRTCEARAEEEVHGLHALGEHDLVDSACRHLRATEVQVLHAHGKMPLRKVTCEGEKKKKKK